ncbi:MAG: NAD(P)-dependent oxidoreductase [Terriglobia bacterium]|jgi:nucleoside-diphosphate-sugar epimerase
MTQTNPSPSNSQARKRFLITGAKGFIGAWIAKALLEGGDRPNVFDIDPGFQRLSAILSENQLAQVNFIQGDVTKYADLDRAIAANGITHVLHLAGLQVPACAADPLRGALVNVLGTLNVFEVARKRRDLVQRIVYASSAAVFGPEEFYGGITVPEGAPLLPGTHYGVFKQCNEGNARVYSLNDGIPSVGIRPWAVYGVGRDMGISSGPTKAIKAAVLRRPYTIGFTGAIDLQYVRDTARIFIRCAERDIAGAKVYTPRGSVVRVEDFIHTLEQVLPHTGGLIKAQGKPLPIAADLDDSALKHDLGEDPRTPLEEGIRETADIFERLDREGRLETKELES